VVPAKG